MNKEFNYLF